VKQAGVLNRYERLPLHRKGQTRFADAKRRAKRGKSVLRKPNGVQKGANQFCGSQTACKKGQIGFAEAKRRAKRGKSVLREATGAQKRANRFCGSLFAGGKELSRCGKRFVGGRIGVSGASGACYLPRRSRPADSQHGRNGNLKRYTGSVLNVNGEVCEGVADIGVNWSVMRHPRTYKEFPQQKVNFRRFD